MASIQEIQVKAARNQSLFREVNDRVDELKNAWLPTTEIDFVCECFQDDCFVPLTLTHHEYLAIRSEPAWFFVAPGHVDERVETILGKRATYWIVEKIEAGKEVAVAMSRSTDAAA